jgi:hypothetical protein
MYVSLTQFTNENENAFIEHQFLNQFFFLNGLQTNKKG